MTPTWPKEEWEKNRFHMACFQVGERAIQGAVIYGHAHHTESIATKLQTEQVCHWVTDRMLDQSTGLRFIAGDFNQRDGDLESMRNWTAKGWINVQVWASQKFRRPIQPTCKGSSTVDHVYVSPELAVYLRDVRVIQDVFPDHAIVMGIFAFSEKLPMVPKWKTPGAIDWDEVGHLPPPSEVFRTKATESNARVTEIFQELEQRVETKLVEQSKRSNLRIKGRCQTMEVHWVHNFEHPPKKGRKGDYQSDYHGVHFQHAKWTRQMRRMENYDRFMKANPSPASKDHIAHQQGLWTSILRGKGFPISFVSWWKNLTGNPFPTAPPAFEVSQQLSNTFRAEINKQANQISNVHKQRENPEIKTQQKFSRT
eukprot:Skav205109  [mRNA]  locus=scaffold2918:243503:244606:- [translate_table: standard]